MIQSECRCVNYSRTAS